MGELGMEGREGMDAAKDDARPTPSVVVFVVPAYSYTWDTAPTFQDTINIEVLASWRF